MLPGSRWSVWKRRWQGPGAGPRRPAVLRGPSSRSHDAAGAVRGLHRGWRKPASSGRGLGGMASMRAAPELLSCRPGSGSGSGLIQLRVWPCGRLVLDRRLPTSEIR